MFTRTDSSSSLYKSEQHEHGEDDEKEPNKKPPSSSSGNKENGENSAQDDGKATENVVKPKLTKAKAATISVPPSRLAAAKSAMGLSKNTSRASLKEIN
jgi:hypothetical protein